MKDGGSAFPEMQWEYTRHGCDGAGHYTTGGMSLRDYFAGQALVGLTANYIRQPENITNKIVAEECYKFADALLAEREKDARKERRCADAERYPDGTCMGYQKGEFDDEPIEACKVCSENQFVRDEKTGE